MDRLKLLLLLFGLSVALDGFSITPVLKFENQKFKIVQFTDIHWINDIQHKTVNDSTLMLMKKVIETERPNLVVFTGDVVVSGGAAEAWRIVTQPMLDLRVPFVVAFGNHDTETDIAKQQALQILKKNPYNLTYNANNNIAGVGNCLLPIKSADEKANKWVIYLFDSQAYSQDTLAVKGYDWIKYSQIEWYRKKSQKFTKANGNPLPSLAFFHIPLPEYESVRTSKSTIGNTSEVVCSPSLNTGLLASFVEKKDVIGVFVGHDHNNDFTGIYANICLSYGRKTGYASAYKEILERGARVIILDENNKKFDTYIRTLSGQYFNYSFKRP